MYGTEVQAELFSRQHDGVFYILILFLIDHVRFFVTAASTT